MDTKSPEHMLKICQSQEWPISLNRRLFENAFEIAQEQVSAVL